MGIVNQFRSVVQWDNPKEWEVFRRFTDRGDELKNASKLIIQPGQGCIFTYEGKIEDVFTEAGMYDLKTDNKPFITTIRKVMYAFESEHKVGLWFFQTGDFVNVRWGTRVPIKYNDPVYTFPVGLRGFGNFSVRLTDVRSFFSDIVAGKEQYYIEDLQELFLSRITQPLSNYLASAKFSYAEIDSHLVEIAAHGLQETKSIFERLGFVLTDFRIEGTSFDPETTQRIGEISNVQADVHAARIAGVDFSELQKLRALRDAANNQGVAGAGVGMFTGLEMGKALGASATSSDKTDGGDLKTKLQDLKSLFDDGLITEEEYASKRQELLKGL